LDAFKRLDAALKRGRPSLICYLPVGDPRIESEEEYLRVLIDEGADVIELGVPAPNPYFDGATIATSMALAIENGVGFARASEIIQTLRATVPHQAMVWMGYPSKSYLVGGAVSTKNVGRGEFASSAFLVGEDFIQEGGGRVESTGRGEPLRRLAEEWIVSVRRSGVDGVLLADRPRGLKNEFMQLRESGIESLPFIGIDCHPEDVEVAVGQRSGYVMLQAVEGTTGVRNNGHDSRLADAIRFLREGGLVVPVVAGFGISGGEAAERVVDAGADGVVVGSALVRAALSGFSELARIVREIRQSLDAQQV